MLFVRYDNFAFVLFKSKFTDDDPRQKLLLTRSPHLAAKLRSYTESLFEPELSSESLKELSVERNLQDAEDDVQATDTIFSFTGTPLPLVCTFDWFLGLLENTVRLRFRLKNSVDLSNSLTILQNGRSQLFQ